MDAHAQLKYLLSHMEAHEMFVGFGKCMIELK